MSQATLMEVLERIGRLGPEELAEVERAVQERLGRSEGVDLGQPTMVEALRDAGLIMTFEGPTPPVPAGFRPASVKGKPVSQTIIEERR